MKKLLFLLLMVPGFLQAQIDSSVELSRMEVMAMDKNRFLHFREESLGPVDNIELGMITATDLKQDIKPRRIICFAPRIFFLDRNFSIDDLHIDEEDLGELIGVLERMARMAESKNATQREIYAFTASNQVVFELRNRPANFKRWDLVIYKRYRFFNKPVPGYMINIIGSEIESLLKILQKIN